MKNKLLERTANLIGRSEQDTNDIIESYVHTLVSKGHSENKAFKMVMIDLLNGKL